MDTFLKFDRKKTEKVDFTAASTYMRSEASDAEAAECTAAFQQLRQEACERALDAGSASLQALYRYYAAVESLSRRVPIEESNVRVLFVWYEAFRQKRAAGYSWSLERAAVLFNCAAQLSQMAAAGTTTSTAAAAATAAAADGLKAAGAYSQQAAGVLDMLRQLLERHPLPPSAAPPPGGDLSPETLALLSHVMLAQAQRCFVAKAALDGLKAGIVSKLAAQHAAYWELARTALQQQPALVALLPRSWPAQVALHEACARADAFKWQAAAHGAADEYGLQVARLQQAQALLQEAKKKHGPSAPAEAQHLLQPLATELAALLARAEKDNDTIYHAPVPAEARLPPLEAKSLVKPLVPPELTAAAADVGSERDRFRTIVPFAVKERLARYEQRRNLLVQQQQSMLQEHNGIAIATLQSLNLPGCLDALEQRQDELLPASLSKDMAQIASEGGHALLEELFETRAKLASEDAALVVRVRNTLDQEEREDAALRAQNPNWPRTPSHTLTAQLRQELSAFAAKIEHANKSDELVSAKYAQYQSWLVRLSATPSQLQNLLPPSAVSAQQLDPLTQQLVADMRAGLRRLDALIAARDALRQQFADKSDVEEVSRALLGRDATDEIFDRGLERVHALAARVAEAAAEQQTLLDQISQRHAQFQHARQAAGASSAQAQREAVLTNLAAACRVFAELRANLGEGIKFYSHLQELLNVFASKCTDFVAARGVEKAELQAAPPPVPAMSMPGPVWTPVMPGQFHPYYPPSGGLPPGFGLPPQYRQ